MQGERAGKTDRCQATPTHLEGCAPTSQAQLHSLVPGSFCRRLKNSVAQTRGPQQTLAPPSLTTEDPGPTAACPPPQNSQKQCRPGDDTLLCLCVQLHPDAHTRGVSEAHGSQWVSRLDSFILCHLASDQERSRRKGMQALGRFVFLPHTRKCLLILDEEDCHLNIPK